MREKQAEADLHATRGSSHGHSGGGGGGGLGGCDALVTASWVLMDALLLGSFVRAGMAAGMAAATIATATTAVITAGTAGTAGTATTGAGTTATTSAPRACVSALSVCFSSASCVCLAHSWHAVHDAEDRVKRSNTIREVRKGPSLLIFRLNLFRVCRVPDSTDQDAGALFELGGGVRRNLGSAGAGGGALAVAGARGQRRRPRG